MAKEEDQLYVRIDGHEEVLEDLKSIEEVVKNINEASKVLEEVRGIKEKAIDSIYSNVQELNERLESIDMEMPELEEGKQPEMPEADMDVEVDSSVDEIHEELQTLQEELSKLGN
jgi:prefoldin subunit 5